MNQNITRGRYGAWLPILAAIAYIVCINLMLSFSIWCTHIHLPSNATRTIFLLCNVSFLLSRPMAQVKIWARAIHMERIALQSLRVAALTSILLWAMCMIVDIQQIGPRQFLAFAVTLLIGFPVATITMRLIIKAIRQRGRNYLNVVIVGSGGAANRIARSLRQDTGYGYMIHGYFDNKTSRHQSIGKYLGGIDDLAQYVRQNTVDEVYFTIGGDDEATLRRVIKITDDNMIRFYYVPQLSRTVARRFHLSQISSTAVLCAHRNPLDSAVNRFIKRAFDITFSSAFLLVSPIIFIPIAIAVKTSSPGPIIFRQKRTGYRGTEFTCLKFRTMRLNAQADSLQASESDPRKTRVGDFLRRTSLDELPQFINVLRGDMSVVGPRPHMTRQTQEYTALIDQYMVRHYVKPGITGWAQVLGYRGATTQLAQMEGRVEKDVWYIENWTLLLDIKIIVRTITNAIRGEENAY